MICPLQVAEAEQPRSNKRSDTGKQHLDVQKLVDHLANEQLFRVLPGRAHENFKNYVLFTGVKDEKKFMGRLVKHRNCMARDKELVANNH